MYGDTHCASCGKKLETLYGNHHCSPTFEKRQETRNRLAEQDYVNRKPTEAMRINSGFYLLSLGGGFG
ncbi:MAG TPA: hypothetical protein VF443_15625 [Nitrospira sp.]